MRLLGLLIVLMTTMFIKASAQKPDDILFTVNYTNANLKQVVLDLEAKSGVHFFYDPIQADSLAITFKAEKKSLDDILTNVFKNTGFNFLRHEQQVFLSKTKSLNVNLASDYYPKDTKSTAQTNVNPAQQKLALMQNRNAQNANLANKIYEIGFKTNQIKSKSVTIAGYIRDLKTGDPIAGGSIFVVNSPLGAISDDNGFYTLTLPSGKQTLLVKAGGHADAQRQLILYDDGNLDITVQESIYALKEVKISADRIANVKSLEMGVNRLDIKAIKQVPTVFGEPDILRVILTLPGVQSVGEASTGFNVRGGSADQNLILLNDATIYNPSHFFGFFSAFNPDVVKDVQLYKSTIPEKFGGRLSSVLEVTNREGNMKKFTGTAGIGLITSRLNIEGPIDSNKTSFIFGGRTTYSNWLLKLLPDAYKRSKASFTDLNLGITHIFNEKNKISLSGYYSTDDFKLNSDTAYAYANKNGSIKWKHDFNDKFSGTLTSGVDLYSYNVKADVNPINAYKLDFSIAQYNFKTDFNYRLNEKHTIGFGLSSIYYQLKPGSFKPLGEKSLVKTDIIEQEQALESAIYLGDKYDVTNDLSFDVGLRYSLYNYLGAHTINNYAPNLPIEEVNQIGTTTYAKNKFIQTYHGPEIRASARYSFNQDLSIKASYNTLRQYIHLLSNTTAIAPTDVWKLSDPNIKPQFGSQVSLGIYKNFKNQTIETSIEVYYKKIKDYLDYKSGAVLVLNHHIETDVVGTKGKAYGAEFFLKKNTGKLNGWLSYAYSRTLLKMDNPIAGATINNGADYPANYDKPHAFNFTGNYRMKQRYSISLNMTYSTGRPITLPIAKYYYGGSERVYYSDRNSYRIPDYFRMDLSFNVEGNHKLKQKTHNSWTFGVYNLTGTKNAYSTYFVQESGVINGYKLSIFASAIPFVNYNIRF
ncbi:TonB-dependent receptor [Pedobacter boryungensis]|uniref:TonB-dependent receptor n=1 Tax=Pedobacter boryungensis TaxID=869962 RepID=A0ABX2DC50_9SPHI|nr:TonB-dependent receptor [Pedobacter boryungensis]NQX31651.1 TonB-dependent receptor [Pedobacter boryungensis]